MTTRSSDLIPYIGYAYVPSQNRFKWNEEQIGENKAGPIMALILEGEFQRAEAPNRNNRIYTEMVLDRETNKLKQFIAERNGLPMGMDHPLPGSDETSLTLVQRMGMENACALCTQLDMNNKVVWGKSSVLEGDHGTGDKLGALVRRGFLPGVSSRGLGGKPNYTTEGFTKVPDDYSMITYDYVSQPSTFNAILNKMINEEIERFQSQEKHNIKLWEVLTSFTKGGI